MQQRELLRVLRDVGNSLGEEEGKKLRSRLGYLQRIARENKDWKMLGTVTGLIYQCEAYERALTQRGLRVPAKRRRRCCAPGQLALFGEAA